MKANVIGVSRADGISNKSGKLRDYDICNVLTLQPIEKIDSQNAEEGTRYHKRGHGYEVGEIALSPEALPLFANLKFPAALDLEIDQQMRFGRLQAIVVGFKAI